jgi:hypothetical protein
MNNDGGDAPETKSQGAGWGWLWWVSLLPVLYVLSTGPILMMIEKRLIVPGPPLDTVLRTIYMPVGWAYMNTPLRKPLGKDWHLWGPSYYSREGKPQAPDKP